MAWAAYGKLTEYHLHTRLISSVFCKCTFIGCTQKSRLFHSGFSASNVSLYLSSCPHPHDTHLLLAGNRSFRMPLAKNRKIKYNRKLMFIFLVLKCFSILFQLPLSSKATLWVLHTSFRLIIIIFIIIIIIFPSNFRASHWIH